METTFRIEKRPHPKLGDEKARVIKMLTNQVPSATILEVGSTAVEGCVGKGDVDFLVRATAAEFIDTRSRLDEILPRNPEQLSSPEYQGYLVDSEVDISVQLTILGSQFDNFELFMNELRRSPGFAQQI